MLVAGEHFHWLFRWARHFVRASHILTHISLTIPPDKFCYDPRLQMGKEGAKRLSSWRRIHFDPWVLLLQACPFMQREGALSLSYLILAQVSVFSRVFQENPTRLSEFPVLTRTCGMLCIRPGGFSVGTDFCANLFIQSCGAGFGATCAIHKVCIFHRTGFQSILA